MLALLLRVVAASVLPLGAFASGSAQLQLSGEVRNEAGSSLDIEVEAPSADGSTRLAALHLFVLEHTSAADVIALLAQRLEALHISHLVSSPAGVRERGMLFLEGISRLEVRVSDGLQATLGLPDATPAAVQVLPPLARRGKGAVRFHGVTWDARLRERGRLDFQVDFAGDASPTGAAEAFVTACAAAHWLSEKPSHESWRPGDSLEGRVLTGTSFAVDSSAGDWGLSLRLAARSQ